MKKRGKKRSKSKKKKPKKKVYQTIKKTVTTTTVVKREVKRKKKPKKRTKRKSVKKAKKKVKKKSRKINRKKIKKAKKKPKRKVIKTKKNFPKIVPLHAPEYFVKVHNDLDIMIKSIKINNPGLPSEIEQAFRIVDRKFFIKKEPYEDEAKHVAFGQTISQPTTVARMLKKLELKPGLNVLEIGTNTGYHAAIASRLVYPGTVTTIEIFPKLAHNAINNINKIIKHLKSKKLKKEFEVRFVVGDALDRDNPIWFEKYDRIFFTAGVSKEHLAEIKQMGHILLREGGLILFPSRKFFDYGGLELWEKKRGKLRLIVKEPGYAFVPIIRQEDLNTLYKVVKK